MMRDSINSVAPNFSARRMMHEYLEKFYIPISKTVLKQQQQTKIAGEKS
jgi:glucan phosphorylase